MLLFKTLSILLTLSLLRLLLCQDTSGSSLSHAIHASVQDILKEAGGHKLNAKNARKKPSEADLLDRKKEKLDEEAKNKRRTYNERKKVAKETRQKHRKAWEKHKNRYSFKRKQAKQTGKAGEDGSSSTGSGSGGSNGRKEEVIDDYEYEYEDEL